MLCYAFCYMTNANFTSVCIINRIWTELDKVNSGVEDLWITSILPNSMLRGNVAVWRHCSLTPADSYVQHSCSLIPPYLPCYGEENPKKPKKVKSVGWDKNSLLTKIKSNAVIITIIIIILMKKEIKKRVWNKAWEKQWCTTQVLIPLTVAQPLPKSDQPLLSTSSQIMCWEVILCYGMSFWPTGVNCPGYSPS